MKIKKIITVAILVVLLGVQLGSASTVAAYNPYGIEYSGGMPLGPDNVEIDPDFLDYFTPLIQTEVSEVTLHNPEMWYQGYINDSGVCRPINYYIVEGGYGPLSGGVGMAGNNRGFIASNDKYRLEVEILSTSVENADSYSFAVGVRPDSTYIYAGWQIYNDAACEEGNYNTEPLLYSNDTRIYVEMNSKLYKKDSNTPYNTFGLEFGITDIDAAQSYSVLNDGNALHSYNMFATSAEGLQSLDPSVTFRNMFVDRDNVSYIYSEYDPLTGGHLSLNNTSNIYFDVWPEAQENGLNLVFGFAGGAASGIEYYALKYNVEYDADENGEITGITGEERAIGDYPSGSSYRARGSYRFSHWIADVDVYLEDGTEIRAGDPITSEQMKKVIVDKDIKFTAIFEFDPTVPNTGASTMETNATQITVSVIGILLGALFIRFLPRLAHKKITFNK